MLSRLLVAVAALGIFLGAVPRARACSIPWTGEAALPVSGATEVSPRSSLILITPDISPPAGLILEANGVAVPIPAAAQLGHGIYGAGEAKNARAMFWSVNVGLQPATSYVLTRREGAVVTELTRFTTAATSEALPGQAPILQALHLWRVHYPAGHDAEACIAGEHEGYIDLNYRNGSIPGTPLEQTISIITLTPKDGGESQAFVFSGVTHFEGAPVPGESGALVDVQSGGRPDPALATWKPMLDPDTAYCATMTMFGRNDLASAPLTSNQVCAGVIGLEAPGAGGCSVGGGAAGLAVIPFALLGWLLARAGRRSRRRFGYSGGHGRRF